MSYIFKNLYKFVNGLQNVASLGVIRRILSRTLQFAMKGLS